MQNTCWCKFVMFRKGYHTYPLNNRVQISHSSKIKVRDHRRLVQQAVGHCCSSQTCYGGLVRYPGQEDVQVVFEQREICRVFISESFGEEVEQPGTMNI